MSRRRKNRNLLRVSRIVRVESVAGLRRSDLWLDDSAKLFPPRELLSGAAICGIVALTLQVLKLL